MTRLAKTNHFLPLIHGQRVVIRTATSCMLAPSMRRVRMCSGLAPTIAPAFSASRSPAVDFLSNELCFYESSPPCLGAGSSRKFLLYFHHARRPSKNGTKDTRTTARRLEGDPACPRRGERGRGCNDRRGTYRTASRCGRTDR